MHFDTFVLLHGLYGLNETYIGKFFCKYCATLNVKVAGQVFQNMINIQCDVETTDTGFYIEQATCNVKTTNAIFWNVIPYAIWRGQKSDLQCKSHMHCRNSKSRIPQGASHMSFKTDKRKILLCGSHMQYINDKDMVLQCVSHMQFKNSKSIVSQGKCKIFLSETPQSVSYVQCKSSKSKI